MLYSQIAKNVSIPLVGIGTFPLHGEELFYSINNAINSGYTLIDSAIGYLNEQDLGVVLDKLRVDRHDLIISSKVDCWTLAGHKEHDFKDGHTLIQAFEITKKNLGIDYLDMYLLHQPFEYIVNQPGLDYIEAYKYLIKLQEEGQVKVIGVSNFGIKDLLNIKNEYGFYPMINQIEYSPYNTVPEIIDFCKEHNIHIEAYSPFGRGNLINEISSNRILTEIARKYKKTPFQIVLRWITQQNITVITRSTNNERIKQNIDLFDFELNKGEMNRIFSLDKNLTFGVNKIKRN